MAHKLWMSGCRVVSSRDSSRRRPTEVPRRSVGLRDASHRSMPPYQVLDAQPHCEQSACDLASRCRLNKEQDTEREVDD